MGPWLRLNFPVRSYVGTGCIEQLGKEARGFGTRALLVTGRRALRRAGITERLVKLLEAAGVKTRVFDQAPPEPDVGTVDRARERLLREGCQMVIEAGGGSALDVGKAAAGLSRETAPTREYLAGRPIASEGVPHIAVATTSGTGAEVTRNSVLIDAEKRVKKSIRGDGLMPAVSFTDPELTLSCPPDVTAASGMDALTQAIESFFSRHAVSVTEALSLRAIESIVPNLPVAFRDGQNLEAREAMALGSYMAGLALGSARLGAVHGLAHPLGMVYHTGHGIICGVLMPSVLERNMKQAMAKGEKLREAMGSEPLPTLDHLLDELHLPHRLGEYPVPGNERLILDYALASGSSDANPVPVDEQYVREILRQVCSD